MSIYNSRGVICIAFAAGLITACVFPHKAAITVIAVMLIMAGFGFCRY